MRMRNKNEHENEQWRFILTSVEVSLELLVCEKHEGSLSEKAHRVPQQNRFMSKLWSLATLFVSYTV